MAAVADLARHCGRSPEQIGIEEIRDFLHHLITQRRVAFTAPATRSCPGSVSFFGKCWASGISNCGYPPIAAVGCPLPSPRSRSGWAGQHTKRLGPFELVQALGGGAFGQGQIAYLEFVGMPFLFVFKWMGDRQGGAVPVLKHEPVQMIPLEIVCTDNLLSERFQVRVGRDGYLAPNEAERNSLLKVGKPLGSKIKELVTIVSPQTLQRWVQASENETRTSTEAKTAAQGNSKPQEIHDLVLKIRRETGWGAGRIKGELYRLGYKNIGRTTINRILRENGFKSEPLETLSIADLQLSESLGGTLKWYETKAA